MCATICFVTCRRLITFSLPLWTLVAAQPALANNGVPFRYQLDMGVGWVNSNTLDNAFDGPGLRMSFETNRAKPFVGVLVDAQTGLGHAHFMKDGSGSLLLMLGTTLASPEIAFRPSFRFGAGREEQHFPEERVVVYSPILGVGLDVTRWEKDWCFGLEFDGRVYLMPMTKTSGDTSGSWLVTEMSYYLMVGHRI